MLAKRAIIQRRQLSNPPTLGSLLVTPFGQPSHDHKLVARFKPLSKILKPTRSSDVGTEQMAIEAPRQNPVQPPQDVFGLLQLAS